jgi:hypothetical protein
MAAVGLHIRNVQVPVTYAKACEKFADKRFPGDAGIKVAEHRTVKGDVIGHGRPTKAEQAIE